MAVKKQELILREAYGIYFEEYGHMDHLEYMKELLSNKFILNGKNYIDRLPFIPTPRDFIETWVKYIEIDYYEKL